MFTVKIIPPKRVRVHGHRLVDRHEARGRGYPFYVVFEGRRLSPENIRHLGPDVIEIIGGLRGRVEVYEGQDRSVWVPDAGQALKEVCRCP